MKSCVHIIPLRIQFNYEETINFPHFNKEDSILLNSTLNINHKEILSNRENYFNVKYFFDNKDKDFLPDEFSGESDIFFVNTYDKNTMIKTVAEKYFADCKNNIIIFSNSIGYTSDNIIRIINLLSVEDNAVIIGKSAGEKAAFFGINYPDLIEDFDFSENSYNSFLKNACKYDNFIYSINNFLTIDNVDDFKILYNELSKKESLDYCSQKRHENFTNLFIEYKDLLK